MRKKTVQKFTVAALLVGVSAWLSFNQLDAQAAPALGGLGGQLTLTKDGEPQQDRANLVVYLEGVPNALPDTEEMVFQVRQKDKQFTPALTVALKGSTVEFPNDDKIFHNVFSLSRTARFDLGLYKSGASKSVKMRRAGVVDVYCNIHPEMVSKILVLETRYYAVTDKLGRFSMAGVPNGDYSVVAWQPYGKEVKGRVKIEPGKVAQWNTTLKRGDDDTSHKRKDGTPYGRYE